MSKQGCLVTSFNLLPLQKLYLQMPSVTFGGWKRGFTLNLTGSGQGAWWAPKLRDRE